ncbi:hypothetical protein SAY86_008764 [Trapa natans]|uniref:Uncharacterized protein n=1 Tax=Trapa natans TaxID=22666 RepID=A0AAN7KFD0_TRANT|nr:hypothetical protein SAY86_008764 [Trapa natans]
MNSRIACIDGLRYVVKGFLNLAIIRTHLVRAHPYLQLRQLRPPAVAAAPVLATVALPLLCLSQMSMAKLLLISMQEAIWWGKSNSSLIWVEGVPEQTGAPPVAWVAVSGLAPNPPPIQPTQPA